MAVAPEVEEETVALESEDVDPEGEGGALKMFALAMESRERMRSSGYVVPIPSCDKCRHLSSSF